MIHDIHLVVDVLDSGFFEDVLAICLQMKSFGFKFFVVCSLCAHELFDDVLQRYHIHGTSILAGYPNFNVLQEALKVFDDIPSRPTNISVLLCS
ncbi:hypothetical protein Sjap_014911 [Stephania japonica]|uniref:Uncharacterized protein n=1 Tax=Stephania japonica TaxID=461633 RepID=A0AAP0II53_9MAGN